MDADRRLLMTRLAVLALAPTPALAADHPPTPSLTEGPFYPRTFPSDGDADLTKVAGRAGRAQGTPLEMSGRLLDRTGRPLAGRRLEIWQCDATGLYHHVGEGEGDPDFQGWGATTTDADGRYAFRTIKPAPYPGRTPHIHFTVAENRRRVLTSQAFIEGVPGNERDFLYRQLGARATLVTMKLSGGSALAGTLDIVLG